MCLQLCLVHEKMKEENIRFFFLVFCSAFWLGFFGRESQLGCAVSVCSRSECFFFFSFFIKKFGIVVFGQVFREKVGYLSLFQFVGAQSNFPGRINSQTINCFGCFQRKLDRICKFVFAKWFGLSISLFLESTKEKKIILVEFFC